MPFVCKPEQRTEGHDKAKKNDIRRKMVDDEIEGGRDEPFFVKKVGTVEEVGRPWQENQTETHEGRADTKPKLRRDLKIAI
ncbi:MAG: hypothetical protein A3F78_20880 [Burkholderiales bacterium RIFCSPLOWO2_12_FULL_61_40]|nr:MAG: hypothetical protein A3F78_20880 [Burkholderiales bacterium RIFCSPLOWO2_12_FULL_61_40]